MWMVLYMEIQDVILLAMISTENGQEIQINLFIQLFQE
jgi:hypothetical protein